MGPLDTPGGAPAEIEVDCYAGYKGEERPLRFRWGGRAFEVEDVLEQWYEPGKSCFRVRAAGAVYLLWRDEEGKWWRLQAQRGRARGRAGT